MSKVGYYFFLKPISFLPLKVLYVLSDFIFFVLYRVVKYRRDVVWDNVRNSFPDKSDLEIKDIVKKFYSHFSDLIVEGIKNFSISKEQAINRCKVQNPEVINQLYSQGRDIILVGGHYNNWEMVALALNPQVKHHVVGIYAPLTDPFFNSKFAESRSKLGTGLVDRKGVPAHFEREKQLSATVFGADQSPPKINDKTYWTTFLNQHTAVLFGVERYAINYSLPVVFFKIRKVKRGSYEVIFTLLEESPNDTTPNSITERHTRALEEEILEAPEFYLWTHKRWKHKKPV